MYLILLAGEKTNIEDDDSFVNPKICAYMVQPDGHLVKMVTAHSRHKHELVQDVVAEVDESATKTTWIPNVYIAVKTAIDFNNSYC